MIPWGSEAAVVHEDLECAAAWLPAEPVRALSLCAIGDSLGAAEREQESAKGSSAVATTTSACRRVLSAPSPVGPRDDGGRVATRPHVTTRSPSLHQGARSKGDAPPPDRLPSLAPQSRRGAPEVRGTQAILPPRSRQAVTSSPSQIQTRPIPLTRRQGRSREGGCAVKVDLGAPQTPCRRQRRPQSQRDAQSWLLLPDRGAVRPGQRWPPTLREQAGGPGQLGVADRATSIRPTAVARTMRRSRSPLRPGPDRPATALARSGPLLRASLSSATGSCRD